MRADENKRLGEFMDAFVSRSGSASEERKAAEAISVSTVTLLILRMDMMDIQFATRWSWCKVQLILWKKN